MPPSDHDLLTTYTRDGSQSAFAELVRRHLDLVYSAARRQVHSPQLAEEIAQSVFSDLARQASRIAPSQPLAAWLHLVTRRTAIDVIRRETRRRTHEQQAAEIATMKDRSPDWGAIEPLLDEAVESLSTTDRAAILRASFKTKACAMWVPRWASPTMPRKNASPAPSINCAHSSCNVALRSPPPVWSATSRRA